MDPTDCTAMVMSCIESDGTVAVGLNPRSGCFFHFYLPDNTSKTGPPFFEHNEECCTCHPQTHDDHDSCHSTVRRSSISSYPGLPATYPHDLPSQKQLRLQCEIVPLISSNKEEGEGRSKLVSSAPFESEEIIRALGDMRARAAMVIDCRRAIGMDDPASPGAGLTLKARLCVSAETGQAELRLDSHRDTGQGDDVVSAPIRAGWYKGLRRTLGSLS